ncbi:RagB/SusD family nutrient uptake outer membrane protein [Pedobacter sp.]|uniref:RagB/SusD family nutrient uptake outer membrane protein n=1 Tax=Pedobacter sp. TaxID=1411316 RepID=UPI002CCF5A1E|nr:RagB/SusD family nutrient uptake outer membrane protein [Pedobacter sp.]HWW37876.1 RagB/SusD family nutrient uptake outer membrane protein [Pedobacter sp.]
MKTIYAYMLIISCSLFLESCKKFVEIDPPTTQLVTVKVFDNNESAIAALTGIYSRMNNDSTLPYTFSLQTGLEADELKNYSTSTSMVQMYKNALNAIEATTPNYWKLGYNYIYQANAVWEGCNTSTQLSPAVKKQLMAEALFIRAYWTFYLTNLFGNVPLVTTTDYTINSKASNASKDQLYNQMIADLVKAEADLNVNYVDGTSVATTTDRIRPNQYAAAALLARVYLYAGNYAAAEQEATKVINYVSLYKIASINNVFLKTSSEAIWQIMMPMPSSIGNTYEGAYFNLGKVPASGLTNNATVSTQLLNAFEPGDLRKINWISSFTSGTQVYYFPYKYKEKGSSTITEYTTPLRLSEQYLIRAEARAQQGTLSGAIGDTDVIRNRAGLTLIKDTNPNINKADLLTVILRERQVELFTEYGHRWLDLKRTGNVDAVMMQVCPLKGGTWSSYKQLWPIPQTELQNDVNLSQNTGYN